MKENLNPCMNLVKPSATLVINELSSQLIKEGKEVYKLGFGQSPFPVPKVIVEALQKNAHQKDYLPVKGLPMLRESVADFFKRKYQLQSTAEDIMVGPGSKELIYDFQVAFKIDELLLPNPSWVSYEPQAQLTNHKVIWLETNEGNNWKILPENIENHCKKEPNLKRTLIFNYPSNPIGITYNESELRDLAVVFKKYNITVIADEIYGEVHHDGQHQTIAIYYPEGTIISTGLSKWAGAGGWRLGVFVFPKDLRYVLDAMAVVASETFTAASAPIQYAAVEAYKANKDLEVYLKNSRSILKAVGLYTYYKLTDIGVSMPKPEGGFYLFPNFSKWSDGLHKKGIKTSKEFCNSLLSDTGIALLPGEAFGQAKTIFAARLSYVDFNGTELLKMLEENPKLEVNDQFIEHNCPNMVNAINKMEQWLNSL